MACEWAIGEKTTTPRRIISAAWRQTAWNLASRTDGSAWVYGLAK